VQQSSYKTFKKLFTINVSPPHTTFFLPIWSSSDIVVDEKYSASVFVVMDHSSRCIVCFITMGYTGA
jgi:hypothetical protein